MLRRESSVKKLEKRTEKTARHGAMKMLPTLLVLPLASLGGVAEMVVPGAGALPNTEVATNIAVRLDAAVLEGVDFSFSLPASPSNSVSVAVGADADEDGDLSLEEADYTFGWDCGSWFFADTATGEIATTPEAGTGTVSRLFTVLRRDIRPGWNLAKVVRRGLGEFDVSVVRDERHLKFMMIMR